MPKFLCLFALAMLSTAAESADPIAVYKSGDYAHALPLLQQAIAQNPKDPALQAALLSVLVYQGKVDDAAETAADDAQNFPQSPEVIAARGEFAFYMGDMPAAGDLFRKALSIKDETPRAFYGLYRLQRAASMYRSARLLCLKAHQLDPDDALIALAFGRYLVGDKRREFLPAFIQSHPWFYGHLEQTEATTSDLRDELDQRKPFEQDGPRQEITVPLVTLHDGQRIAGLGIQLSIEGGKKLTLLLDTGASGMLLSQPAIDKAGLNHVGSTQVGGIGSKGLRNAFLAVADTCSVSTIQFKTCVFQATEGKKHGMDNDGLMGPDVFSDYIITIDFQRRTMHLVPLPERNPNPQAYDRAPLPMEQGFTPVYRQGNHLFISTQVNRKSTGLFLLDTGAQIVLIDNTFAQLTTKIHGNEYVRIHGVSGSVKDVFEADKAELLFARFRLPSSVPLTAIDLNNGPGHQELRMDGILGFPVLVLFRLSLDYRNGLVNFDYVLDRK